MKLSKRVGMLMAFLLAFSISAAAGVYVVNVGPPSGGDDTAVLQTALDECVAPHPQGCVVQLSAGIYKSSQLLATNFHGKLKGRGMDVTIIEALRDLHVGPGSDANPPTPANPWPVLITFMDGDFSISDLTARGTEYSPFVEYPFFLAILAVTGQSSPNAVVERVALQGAPGIWNGFNAFSGFAIIPPGDPFSAHGNGTVQFLSSRVSGTERGIFSYAMQNGSVTFGGSQTNTNTIEAPMSVFLMDLDNTLVDTSHNRIKSVGGSYFPTISVQQGVYAPVSQTSRFHIHNNSVEASAAYAIGIGIFDLGPLVGLGKLADAVISDNTIQLAGNGPDPALAGIDVGFTQGTTVSNNRITGSALVGVLVEGASQCMLLGNNLQQLQALWVPVALLAVVYCESGSAVAI